MKHVIILFLILSSCTFLFAGVCAGEETQKETAALTGISLGMKYLAATLAVGLCAIATGIAQSRIGAAGMGSIVEKPEVTGTVIICIAIPETMVILGFVVAAMIILF